MYLRKLSLVLSFFVTGQLCEDQGPRARLFTQTDFKGPSELIAATDCKSLIDTKFHRKVQSINTQGTCVHLYRSPNCTGEYLLTTPGSPAHNVLEHFISPSGMSAFGGRIESMGPCTDICDRTIPSRPSNASNTIQVFFNHYDALYGEEKAFSGNSKTFEVDGCVPVSGDEFNPFSTPIKFGWKGLCIEVYRRGNCTEPFPIQRTGSGHRQNPVGQWHKNSVKSVSLCGYNCIARHTDNDTVFTADDSQSNNLNVDNSSINLHKDKVQDNSSNNLHMDKLQDNSSNNLHMDKFQDNSSNYSALFVPVGMFLLVLLVVAVVTVLYRRRLFLFGLADGPQAFRLLRSV